MHPPCSGVGRADAVATATRAGGRPGPVGPDGAHRRRADRAGAVAGPAGPGHHVARRRPRRRRLPARHRRPRSLVGHRRGRPDDPGAVAPRARQARRRNSHRRVVGRPGAVAAGPPGHAGVRRRPDLGLRRRPGLTAGS
ncbi:hypothetical protein NOCARDAX2BIS_400006 [Nocardioides sp. AX2bis]|nr:hypothetical protein NOCARDAX2BIS_400006 [Nocardioides sp. AX2bis]